MLDIIAAAFLIAFGVLAVYFSVDGKTNDKSLILVMLAGIAAVVAGGWIILTHVTLAVLLIKLAGLILGAVGLFLLIGFPDVLPDYQPEGMSRAGVLVGLILIIIGLYILFFWPL